MEQVVAYLDDVILYHSDPTAHVKTMRALFERLHKHNLKLSLPKARRKPLMLLFWATSFRQPVSVPRKKVSVLI